MSLARGLGLALHCAMTDAEAQLPKFARDRIHGAAPEGVVVEIQVRPRRRAPTTKVDRWDLDSGADHGGSPTRAVTLFQYEHLAVIESLLGRPVEFGQTRRNLCVRGFNLEVARAEAVVIGETVLRLTGRCHPCARMDETLGPGGFVAMFGHGGWTASIIANGVIATGDTVRLR